VESSRFLYQQLWESGKLLFTQPFQRFL